MTGRLKWLVKLGFLTDISQLKRTSFVKFFVVQSISKSAILRVQNIWIRAWIHRLKLRPWWPSLKRLFSEPSLKLSHRDPDLIATHSTCLTCIQFVRWVIISLLLAHHGSISVFSLDPTALIMSLKDCSKPSADVFRCLICSIPSTLDWWSGCVIKVTWTDNIVFLESQLRLKGSLLVSCVAFEGCEIQRFDDYRSRAVGWMTPE